MVTNDSNYMYATNGTDHTILNNYAQQMMGSAVQGAWSTTTATASILSPTYGWQQVYIDKARSNMSPVLKKTFYRINEKMHVVSDEGLDVIDKLRYKVARWLNKD